MEVIIENSLLAFTVLSAITFGLVQVIKKANIFQERFLPLLAVVIGLIVTVIANFVDFTALHILTGIAVGLSSSGFFNQKLIFGK